MGIVYEICISALCAWRENRSGGEAGMQSVLNVLKNRANMRGTTMAIEATKPWQFSSMTATGDPQLRVFPTPPDSDYILAEKMAQQAIAGSLPDLTGGATFYYALGSPKPAWASQMTATVEISGQLFFKSNGSS